MQTYHDDGAMQDLFIRSYKDDLLAYIARPVLDVPLKEPDELTTIQKLAIAYMAGCEIKYVDGEIRSKKKIGITLIDGQYQVSESVQDA